MTERALIEALAAALQRGESRMALVMALVSEMDARAILRGLGIED